MVVYIAKNKINGKIYIGKTIDNLDKRKKEHYYHSETKNGSYFQRAIKKHGLENFEWSVLCECKSIQELNNKEIELIKFFNSQNHKIGYNITSGGENNDVLKWHPKRDEIIEKIRQSNLKQRLPNKGKTYEEIYGEKKGKRLRQIRRETNIMNRKTVYECWIDKYGKEIADQKKKDQAIKCSLTTRGINKKPDLDESKKRDILLLWNDSRGLTVTEISKKINISRFMIKKFLNSRGYSGYGLTMPMT